MMTAARQKSRAKNDIVDSFSSSSKIKGALKTIGLLKVMFFNRSLLHFHCLILVKLEE